MNVSIYRVGVVLAAGTLPADEKAVLEGIIGALHRRLPVIIALFRLDAHEGLVWSEIEPVLPRRRLSRYSMTEAMAYLNLLILSSRLCGEGETNILVEIKRIARNISLPTITVGHGAQSA